MVDFDLPQNSSHRGAKKGVVLLWGVVFKHFISCFSVVSVVLVV